MGVEEEPGAGVHGCGQGLEQDRVEHAEQVPRGLGGSHASVGAQQGRGGVGGVDVVQGALLAVQAGEPRRDVGAARQDAAEDAVDHGQALRGGGDHVAVLAEEGLEGRGDVGCAQVVPADVGHDVVEGRAAHAQDVVEIAARLQDWLEVHGEARLGEVAGLHQEGLLGVLDLGQALGLGLDEGLVGQPQLQVHFDPRQDLGLLEGLGHEVHAADLKAADLAGGVRQGRDEDDGDIRGPGVVLEQFAGGVAVLAGHEDVEQDEVRRLFQGRRARGRSAGRGNGPVAAFGEHDVEQLDVQRFVVDDQDAGGRVVHGARLAWGGVHGSVDSRNRRNCKDGRHLRTELTNSARAAILSPSGGWL
ncbi:hypothetical protein DSECCO2_482330 [anaerobic digester metagenome]